MAVFTQLEKLDWSGLASSERDLKKICKGAVFGKGLAVHSAEAAQSEKAVAAWAKKVI